MRPLKRIFDTARSLNRHIVLPEGEDARVQEAAIRTAEQCLARVTLLARDEAVDAALLGRDLPIGRLTIIDPRENADIPRLAEAYHALRAHKGVTLMQATENVSQPIVQAAMRVRLGLADGTVGGAVATTAETVRAALQIIGKAPGIPTVSSFFLMLACNPHAAFRGAVIFSDCGLVIDPTADELATIARSAANSCRTLLAVEPQVAMLSFSTAGSAEHENVAKVRRAVEIARAEEPDLCIEGEMQFDAAIEEAIRERKLPDSRMTGRPTVFVFPNLTAGNIGYKIAQRLGHMDAIGPILQGLAKPANDLSRGCSVDDIVAAIAVTALQSSHAANQTSNHEPVGQGSNNVSTVTA